MPILSVSVDKKLMTNNPNKYCTCEEKNYKEDPCLWREN